MAGNYTVKQGDYLAKIAKEQGFGDWKIIYDHPKNKAFKEKRPDPNILFPGDELYIPEIEPAKFKVATDQKHVFKLKASKEKLILNLLDVNNEALVEKPYSLEIAGEAPIEDITSSQGVIETEIPCHVNQAKLTIWADSNKQDILFASKLKIGHLDPIEQNQGIQTRLNNLGFDSGKEDGVLGEQTKAAVMAFQEKYAIDEKGEIGPLTMEKLKELYGV